MDVNVKLNCSQKDLTDKDLERIEICAQAAHWGFSLSQIETVYGIPHSTIHYWVRHRCKNVVSKSLYWDMVDLFKKNKKNHNDFRKDRKNRIGGNEK